MASPVALSKRTPSTPRASSARCAPAACSGITPAATVAPENRRQFEDRNMQELKALDAIAKDDNTLLGRVVRMPAGGDWSFYQVIKINKRTVTLKHCAGTGFDAMVLHWGPLAVVDRGYVERELTHHTL
jgi:hypothetical protein